MTGGVAGATAGTLMLFVGGADEDIAAAQPVLRALGTPEGGRRLVLGDGQMMKIGLNQHLCSIHLAAAAEALSLAGRLGLDQQRVLDLLGRGAAASWMLTDRGPRMLTPPQTVNSSVDIFAKDSQLVQATASTPPLRSRCSPPRASTSWVPNSAEPAEDDDSQVIAYLDSLS